MREISAQEAFDNFKPETCVFVISIDENGKPNGMIAGYNVKCSLNPPMFAVGLSEKGNTQKLVRKSGEFVIAVPNKELQKEVEFFGSKKGSEINKFEETGIKIEKAKYVKSPLLKDATINFECKVRQEVKVGDHHMFIGEIVASYINHGKKVLLNMKKIHGKRVFKEF
ncbi:MAG: flavin reductase family protein [archaeon]